MHPIIPPPNKRVIDFESNSHKKLPQQSSLVTSVIKRDDSESDGLKNRVDKIAMQIDSAIKFQNK